MAKVRQTKVGCFQLDEMNWLRFGTVSRAGSSTTIWSAAACGAV